MDNIARARRCCASRRTSRTRTRRSVTGCSSGSRRGSTRGPARRTPGARCSENRKLVDKDANRYFFVPDPVAVEIEGLPPVGPLKVSLHPDFPGRGDRTLPAGPKVHVAREDFEKLRGSEIRLKDFCNVVLDHKARFLSMENRDIPKIQWVPHGVNAHVVMPDGSEARGLAEPAAAGLKVDDLVQFERFGFARIDHVSRAEVRAYFAHR